MKTGNKAGESDKIKDRADIQNVSLKALWTPWR